MQVMCDDSLHDKVQKVLLERTAVQVAGHLQYDAPGPRTTGAACVYGCVQLMVWTRQLTAHHEPGIGTNSAQMLTLVMLACHVDRRLFVLSQPQCIVNHGQRSCCSQSFH